MGLLSIGVCLDGNCFYGYNFNTRLILTCDIDINRIVSTNILLL